MIAGYWSKLRGNAVIAAHLRRQRSIPFLPRHQLEALRDRRIRDVLTYAARTVPYYREWFARERIGPREIRGAADLARLPVLDRDLVRAQPRLFVTEASAARDAVSFSTSGTTGTPLEVRHDRRSLLANLAFGERERDPVIRLCGGVFPPKELYVGYETSTFKRVQAFYEEHTLLPVRPQRRCVSLLEPVEKVAAIANAERPDVLVGYGGWIDRFFKTVATRGIDLQPLKVVMYMGEALPHGAREFIEGRFGIPVLSRYNAVEAFKIGFFCERRTGFHLHEDLCHVRIRAPDGRTAAPGVEGEVVISNLVNRATVLLNYPIGDVAAMAAEPCPCGRTFRLLSELEGRVEDVLPLADGRFVHPRAIWQVFKNDREILQYQLTQQELQRFVLTLVTADEPAFQRALARARPELARLLGAGVIIVATSRREIDRGTNGKFRAVASLCAAIHKHRPAGSIVDVI
jgi:phenylacetate-CoA ligase